MANEITIGFEPVLVEGPAGKNGQDGKPGKDGEQGPPGDPYGGDLADPGDLTLIFDNKLIG